MAVVTHSAPSAEPNVTPMIDVLLVVLIVFMVASARVFPVIEAQLPDTCGVRCATSGEAIVLEVLPGPTYRINRRQVSAAALEAELISIYTGRPDKSLQVAGSRGVKYQDVVHAMDVAKGAGVIVLGISPKGTTP